MLISTCLFFLVITWITGAPDPSINGNEHQPRKLACHELHGRCIKRKKPCPLDLPEETDKGAPYCRRRKRCCYPGDTSTGPCPLVGNITRAGGPRVGNSPCVQRSNYKFACLNYNGIPAFCDMHTEYGSVAKKPWCYAHIDCNGKIERRDCDKPIPPHQTIEGQICTINRKKCVKKDDVPAQCSRHKGTGGLATDYEWCFTDINTNPVEKGDCTARCPQQNSCARKINGEIGGVCQPRDDACGGTRDFTDDRCPGPGDKCKCCYGYCKLNERFGTNHVCEACTPEEALKFTKDNQSRHPADRFNTVFTEKIEEIKTKCSRYIEEPDISNGYTYEEVSICQITKPVHTLTCVSDGSNWISCKDPLYPPQLCTAPIKVSNGHLYFESLDCTDIPIKNIHAEKEIITID